MNVIKEGVEYEVEFFNKNGKILIVFTHKENNEFVPGTTNEEIIHMLIDRFASINKKQKDSINEIILDYLISIRRLLSKRITKKNKKKNDN